MNVSELARKLNIPLQELREILPQVGFDIGSKAIKVDNEVANKILRNWPRLYREYLNARQKLREEREKELILQRKASGEVKTISIPSFITVKDFALKLNLPLVKVMSELMKNGVLATLNQKIDHDTASIIADEFGFKTELIHEDKQEEAQNDIIHDILSKEQKEWLLKRPPVIVVMGHVDHGKTKLLDTIRKTNVIDKEAGGITQHIGAYQVTKSIENVDGKMEERVITFIDTPGHEAFTAMRSRGAKIADIAILVVAADDGVKPQTVEAIKIIEQAHLPIIVAINKIDKEGANIEKTKQELSQLNLVPEDWGGKVTCMPVSAKAGTGINELLETIILTAELNEDKIKANPKSQGIGTVIESHIDKGEGPVATVIVQNGTVYKNEYIAIEEDVYGRIRSMKNYLGKEIEKAEPSTPVKIIGLKILPRVGDIVMVSMDKVGKAPKKKFENKLTQEYDWHHGEKEKQEAISVKKINVVLKADVVGSLEAITESLAKIESSEVKIELIKKGLGNITDNDILTAKASEAVILAFNVAVNQEAEKLAVENNVTYHKYRIIYELLDFIKDKIAALTEPKYEEVFTGKMRVLAIFRKERQSMILGGKVISGEIKVKDTIIKVTRNENIIALGSLKDLESAKQKVGSCLEGQECGIRYEGNPVIKEGDVLEFYIKQQIRIA